MDKLEFRSLTKDEIDVRVSMVNQNGCGLLLYKDARVDMRILDEVVGAYNWKRQHEFINGVNYCTVSIWDKEKEQWISKQDVGVESYTEKDKGSASDSFKRACFNWGIGRELYTAPFIWIKKGDVNISENNGKQTTRDTFLIEKIVIENGIIVGLAIINQTRGKRVFVWQRKDNTGE